MGSISPPPISFRFLKGETAAGGISDGGMMALFRSQPPLESRIEALQSGDLASQPAV